jgi:hypothetical protein
MAFFYVFFIVFFKHYGPQTPGMLSPNYRRVTVATFRRLKTRITTVIPATVRRSMTGEGFKFLKQEFENKAKL